ncbi:MAG: hypothetical protein JXB38_05855 [Anaerolineales bacterium]|nr:hypothetical protein [Anaerolineales bacterium]
MEETAPVRIENKSIGFVDIAQFENGGAYRGGCLVTDLKTYPQEFRITNPVRPTNLQSILYGSTLDEYIYIELICIPLIRAIKSTMSLIIVQRPVLLEIRPKIQTPMIHIGDGEIKLHPDFLNESTNAKRLLSNTNRSKLIEPFSRIQTALAEAHSQKIGEPTE